MPPKQKSDTVGYQQMKKDLSAGNIPMMRTFRREFVSPNPESWNFLQIRLWNSGRENPWSVFPATDII